MNASNGISLLCSLHRKPTAAPWLIDLCFLRNMIVSVREAPPAYQTSCLWGAANHEDIILRKEELKQMFDADEGEFDRLHQGRVYDK